MKRPDSAIRKRLRAAHLLGESYDIFYIAPDGAYRFYGGRSERISNDVIVTDGMNEMTVGQMRRRYPMHKVAESKP
jgi:hypothetical protein